MLKLPRGSADGIGATRRRSDVETVADAITGLKRLDANGLNRRLPDSMSEAASHSRALNQDLEDLGKLDTRGLARRWRTLIGGTMPPAGLGRALMLRVLSYRLQALRYGDLDRASRQALNDIFVRSVGLTNGRIDIIVVYKVDRLTRSLSAFAKLIEIFDANKVSFVSVTQSFNTTSSMGRLTLNVLLSFAQFEREVSAERIRDKIAASKKKGMWMGGCVPLGYRVENRKLVIDEAEAETVRLIFERYLDLGSLRALQRDLLDKGIWTRSRVLASGRSIGGIALTIGPLNHLLKNRMYLGEINHRRASYPGEHRPIIAADLFEAVQTKLKEKRNFADLLKTRSGALLKGRFFNDVGLLMSSAHTTKKRIRYRYYVSTATVQGRTSDGGSERKSERAIRLTLSLAFLDPKLVRAALQGSLPVGVSARRLLDASANWDDQWHAIGLSRPI